MLNAPALASRHACGPGAGLNTTEVAPGHLRNVIVANAVCQTSGYSFTVFSITTNAPPCGGIALSNAQVWIYINSVDDIRAALLDHVNERNASRLIQIVLKLYF